MRKSSTVGVLVAAFVTLAAPAAVATGFKGSMTGSRVQGVVTITGSYADVSGKVWDTKADGHCATLRGNWDRMWAPDHGFDVARTCGNGSSQYGYGSDPTDLKARDFEVRTETGGDYRVVWQGTNRNA